MTPKKQKTKKSKKPKNKIQLVGKAFTSIGGKDPLLPPGKD